MRKTISLLLALALLLGCACVFASAEDAVAELQAAKPVGDVNGDGTINAKDVTILRRYLAGGYGIAVELRAADANGDGTLSAKDITVLRRYLAGGYGIELGLWFEAPELTYNGAVTGGQLYTDLGAPSFGEYMLTVTVDGVGQDAAPYAAKIVEGNTDALTPEASYTEAVKDESAKTVTLTVHLLFADGGVQYEPVTLAFNGGGDYRLLGRGKQLETGVRCDWQGDGVEFVADCGGDLYITASRYYESTGNYLQFRVIVDGVLGDWVTVKASYRPETRTLLAFPNVPAGRHTIKIMRDSPVDHCESTLLSVTVNADPASVRASEPRPKLLEVMGASTATGAGILPIPEGGDPTSTHNTATFALSFGYLVAEDLNMDVEAVVKGTLGIVARAGTGSSTNNNLFNIPELYEYQNRYRNAYANQELEPYTFPRKADVVILMINENDGKISSEEFTPALTDFIGTIRRCNGGDVKIVVFYYINSAHQADIESVLAADPSLYSLKVRTEHNGSDGNHASGAAHRSWATMLTNLIRTIPLD